jgi:hypothetical protein
MQGDAAACVRRRRDSAAALPTRTSGSISFFGMGGSSNGASRSRMALTAQQ